MFKQSRRKIVAVILSVLVLLLFGTFCTIYLASYTEMTNRNREMLNEYVETYMLPNTMNPFPDHPKNNRDPFHPKMLELSTFYSVAISNEGEVLAVDTADLSIVDEDELVALAQDIIADKKSEGIQENLIYRVADKSDYVLVAFLDNTVMLENADTLFTYTLIFGSAALVLMFFLARYLANRIVSPLEVSYQKQKQFVSDAGHELKTPVAVVSANIEMLEREIGENQWLSNIQYENERMSALIIQLLDLARAENVTPTMEHVDFSRLVCGEALPFETVAFENGLIFTSEIEENIWIQGNSVQLKQITSILIDNALNHSQSGKEVTLCLRKEKNHACLSVINDGEIPEEQRKHLFERFYRTDSARSDEGQNYGLGLAIAKAIAEAHKGTIDVHCSKGKVEFIVKLPIRN